MVKVSVVVPTWRTKPEHLARLVRSIDAQTMPAEDFEVIFVDDGSDDETFQRVSTLAQEHPNFHAEALEHYGWPGAARNRGVVLAKGEYVFFVDHDDELFPEALQASYEMGDRNKSDVVNPKEIREDNPGWGLDVWVKDIDNVPVANCARLLLPNNVHKLFKRSFLINNKISFTERPDVEEKYIGDGTLFLIQVLRFASTISVLSSVLCYHWIHNDETKSSLTLKPSPNTWWLAGERALETIRAMEFTEEQQPIYRHLLIDNYRIRLLIPGRLAKLNNKEIESKLTGIANEYVPVEWDEDLKGMHRIRSFLLRNNQWDHLRQWVTYERSCVGISKTKDVYWESGKLVVTMKTQWHDAEGRSHPLRRDGDRILIDVPDSIDTPIPLKILDVTHQIQDATTTLSIRSRKSFNSLLIPTTNSLYAQERNGRVDFSIVATAKLDPSTVDYGKPLTEPTWDVFARNELFGAANQRRVRAASSDRVAVHDGHVLIAYPSKVGTLVLDIDQNMRALIGSAPLQATMASAERNKSIRGFTFSIPFLGVAMDDDQTLDATVLFGDSVEAPVHIVGRNGQALISGDVSLENGKYPLTVKVGHREMATGLSAVVSSRGKNLQIMHGTN